MIKNYFKRFQHFNNTTNSFMLLAVILLSPFFGLSQKTALEPSNAPMGIEPENYAEESVLHNGYWVKMAITETGVYKITYDDLEAMGFQAASLDPRNIAIYGNGGAMLPETNASFRYDDLFENAITIIGENDGSFDPEDLIFFYGMNTLSWELQNNRFVQQINYFSDTNYYFITLKNQAGKRVVSQPQAIGTTDRELTTFLDYQVHEVDLENLIMSGKEWYGEQITKEKPLFSIDFYFPHREITRPVRMEMNIVGRSISETFYFAMNVNGQNIVPSTPFMQLAIDNSAHAREVFKSNSFNTDQDHLNFEINVDAQNDDSKAWLNYIRVNTWRKLIYDGAQLRFRNPEAIAEGGRSNYVVKTNTSDLFLWDISHPLLPRSQAYNLMGDQLSFKINSDTLKEFIAFSSGNALTIGPFKKIENQNLHSISSCDMLIVVHPNFLNEAHELAGLHYADDGLESIVVNLNDIYNEFGGGKADITAIRDFVRMVYIKSSFRMKYLLLFGDGSYDYKNRIANNTNFVPTYQASGSMIETQSYVSDDYFGLMGTQEGSEMFGILDIGIGRFPVRNRDEAKAMVEKTKVYLQGGRLQTGEWRNNITFMADDADSNLHFNQAETLANDVDTGFKNLNIKKIYLDSYKRTTVPAGYRYPDANKTLLSVLDEGSLVVNYTGHGGITGLTDEKVFTIGEIENMNNINKLPFFITATCEFSRFDNPNFVSAGERLLLNPNGGAIALMTTTRLAFAHSNFAVNKRLYEVMFESNKQQIRRLGDIIRMSKNPTSIFIYNFVLLGNPALRLNYPEYKVSITEFNGNTSYETVDTLGAMSKVVLKGEITDQSGEVKTDFNGYIYPKMFDKKSKFKTLANDNASIASFFAYFDKLIYKGKITVNNGKFAFEYLVPKDIAFQFGKAKISFYAVDTINFADAGGYFDDIVLGGVDQTVQQDYEGPEIEMYINEPNFADGDYSSPDAMVFIRLSDPQGIHFLGNSIGRDIVLTHKSDGREEILLNTHFSPTLDSYRSGTIAFPMTGLSQGTHHISLKVWDLHNNSSEKEIWFKVDPKAPLNITHLQNHPNPFSGNTSFTFQHNKPNQKLDVTIEVYDQMGNFVTHFSKNISSFGTHSSPIEWNGTTSNGSPLPAGMYVYKVHIKDGEGQFFSAAQKILIVPTRE
jgi:hypothetical protein